MNNPAAVEGQTNFITGCWNGELLLFSGARGNHNQLALVLVTKSDADFLDRRHLRLRKPGSTTLRHDRRQMPFPAAVGIGDHQGAFVRLLQANERNVFAIR